MENTEKKKGIRYYKKYLGFGIGAVGLDLSYGLFNSFLNNYLTDVLLISTSFIGVFFFITRILDGFNDPFMGTIVDNTRSKYGKFRPWIVIGSFANATVMVFMFANPGFNVSKDINVSLYIYVSIMYVLWSITDTIADIPYWSMVPTLTSDPEERTIVSAIPRFFSGLGQIIIVVLTFPMVKLFGNGDKNSQTGFTKWVLICAVIYAGLSFVTFFSTKNISTVPEDRQQEKFNLLKAFKTIKSNDQLLVFMVTAFLYNTGWYLTNGLAVYFFKSVIGDENQLSLFGTIIGVGQACGLILIPLISKKIERNRIIKGTILLTVFGYLGMYIAGEMLRIYPLLLIIAFVSSMGVSSTFVGQTILLSDVVDYGEYKLGYRSDSIVFSMKSFLQKFSYSIQALVMNIGLSISRYDGNLDVQLMSAQRGIAVMMFLIPPLFAFGAYIVFSKKYKLNSQVMAEVNDNINR